MINRGGHGVVDMIDVGSVGGLPAEWRDHAHLVRNLLNFEPLDKPRKRGSVITIPAALWSRAETRYFYRARGGSEGDSLLLPNTDYVRENFETLRGRGPTEYAETWFERSGVRSTVQLRTTTLDEVLASMPLRYHFLKLDAQGADFEILKGAEEFITGSCQAVQAETFTIPLYKDVALLDDFDEYLGRRGFERVWTAPAHGTFDSQHDVLYTRPGVSLVRETINRVYDV